MSGEKKEEECNRRSLAFMFNEQDKKDEEEIEKVSEKLYSIVIRDVQQQIPYIRMHMADDQKQTSFMVTCGPPFLEIFEGYKPDVQSIFIRTLVGKFNADNAKERYRLIWEGTSMPNKFGIFIPYECPIRKKTVRILKASLNRRKPY